MKKHAKIIALAIAALVVVGLAIWGITALVGGEETPQGPVQPYNALGAFVDGGDGVYDLTTNTSSELTFNYDKVDEALAWSHIYTEISADAALENYKKLVITAKGNGTMMIKLEGADSAAKEVSINVQANATTYDWNLMNDAEFLKGVTKIVIFGAPGKAEGVGNITITSLTFDEAIAGATGNFIIATGYNDIPSNVNEYNGKDVNFDFNAKWESGEQGVYEIEQDATTKEVSVKYKKSAGMEWSFMVSNVKGNFGKFKYVVLVAQGQEGKDVLLKAEGQGVAKEISCQFDGTKQTFVLDISTLTEAQKSSIAKIILFGSANKILDGRFIIYEAYMTETAPIEVEETIVNEYDGTSETFDISDNWYDAGDGIYTTSKVQEGVKVEYNKPNGKEWSALKAYVRNVAAKFNYVVVEATGVEGATIMLKAANGVEKQFTFEAGVNQFVLDISGMEDAAKEGLTEFIIFGHPGSAAEGSFIITNAYYAVEVEGVELPTKNEYTQYAEEFDINKYWVDNNTGTYTVENNVISWNKPAGCEWVTFKTEIVGLANEFKYLYLEVKGTAGQQILVKPNDNGAYEKYIDLTEEVKGYYVAIPEGMTVLHIFGAPGLSAVEGHVEVVTAKLVRHTYLTEAELSVNLMDSFFANADPVYTFTENTISYNKGNYSWAFFKALFAGETSGFTSINLTVTGPAGVQLLVKPNDDSAYEQWLDLDGSEQTFTINKLPENLNSLLVFVAPNTENVEGTIQVSEFEAVKGIQIDGEDLAVSYEDKSGNGYYTISESAEGVDIQYNITSGGWYYVEITPTAGTVEDVEKISFIFDGNVRVLVKPNDNGAIEKWVTIAGEQLVEVPVNGDLARIVFFISPEAAAEGTLVIKRLTVSYKSATENVYVSGETFDVNHFWSGDEAEYTFVEEDGKVVVNYHTTGGWKFFANPIVGVTDQFNYLKVTLKAAQNVKVTLKPADQGAYEKHIDLVANEQVTYYLAIPANMNKIVGFIAGDQDAGATGTVEFLEMTLVNVTDPAGNIAAALKDTGDNVYTVTATATGATIAYAKTNQEWANMKVNLIPVSTEEYTLTAKVTGPAGVKVLVKLNNQTENWHTMTGAEDTFTCTNVPASINMIHVFIAGGSKDVSGEIHLELTFVEKQEQEIDLSNYDLLDWQPALGYWYSQDQGEKAYTLNTSQDKYISSSVRFTKEQLPVGSVIVVADGYQYRPDAWTSETGNNASRPAETTEAMVVVDEAWWGSYVLRAFNVSRVGKPALTEADFAAFEEAFKIYVPKAKEPLTYSVVDNEGNVYTVTGDINEGSMTVSFTKTSEWNALLVNLSETTKVASIKVVCSAEVAQNLIIKPNDGFEKNLTLTTDGTTFEWTFDGGLDLTKVVFIAAPGEPGTSGTFQVVSFEIELA